MLRVSELETKDIVNMHTGKRLGFLQDVEVNLETGMIDGLIVGSGGKMLGWLAKDGEWMIPWSNVVKIGNDVILVHAPKSHP
ncbi:YlmC/YmxH family sporulation protein [Salsuginibacillus kocurii]|uniref:YlmC/YmxH family sporulation protein n=1 Tax=Salsuginibacillus kocurii TaxID=427078 RepID=UPI0003A12D5D|nr:YlmC/YmxH family sporulation protein [Salsuginibacillus kocurii]